MTGIRIESKLWPSVWASLADQDGEPLFIVVDDSEETAAVGILTLDLIQEWGAQIAAGDLADFPYADLHVILPGCFRLVSCELDLARDAKGFWLVARHEDTGTELHRSRLD